MNREDRRLAKIDLEVKRRLESLRSHPERLERYDLGDDSDTDAGERWDEIEQIIRLEVQTEFQRDESADAPDEANSEPLELLHNRFELRQLIGRGAQGRTFLGYDCDTGEEVAVKELLLRDVEDWKAIELFEREGQTLRHLDHPGIPGYVDAFHIQAPDSGERFFLVQEFVDGTDLKTLVEQGKHFREKEVKALLEELLEILVYLQQLSPPVIHRDIKPSNIMRRANGDIALIDFGAVQSVIPHQTGGSTIIGTSGYMPIEQLMGRSVAATDLYALGATAIHLLSRRHPADLAMKAMYLQFHAHVNTSAPFTSFLEGLLNPHVERRIPTARMALLRLRQMDEAQQLPHRQGVRPSATPPTRRSSRQRSPGPRNVTAPDQNTWTQSLWKKNKLNILAAFFTLFVVPGLYLGFMIVVPIIASVFFNFPLDDAERCEDGDGGACVSWAQSLKDDDPEKAEHAYAQGCDFDDLQACKNYARLALERQDFEEATPPLKRSCDLDSSWGCATLALIYQDEESELAETSAKKACELESARGCNTYAAFFLRRFEADEGDPDYELRRAWRYADRACNDWEPACATLATVELYEGDTETALSLAKRSANKSEDSDKKPEPHAALGLVFAATGQLDDATDSFEEAILIAADHDLRQGFRDSNPQKSIESTITKRLSILAELYPTHKDSIEQAIADVAVVYDQQRPTK